jgi:hypothetical protein
MCEKNYEIIKQVFGLPDKIKNKEFELLELQRSKVEIETQLKYIENEMLNEIINESENDKPKFSNETKRKLELKNRLNMNNSYVELYNRHKLLLDNIAENEISYTYLKNLLRSYETISRLN